MIISLSTFAVVAAGVGVWSIVAGKNMFKEENREKALPTTVVDPEARQAGRKAHAEAMSNGQGMFVARRAGRAAYLDALPQEAKDAQDCRNASDIRRAARKAYNESGVDE